MHDSRPALDMIDHPFSPFREGVRTERLILRMPRDGDARSLWEAIEESREHLAPWMPWVSRYGSPDDAHDFVRRAETENAGHTTLFLLIESREQPGRILGGTGFHDIDWSIPALETGYWLRASAEGHGYMTEAARAMRDFAFQELGAQRLAITCDPANVRSARVAERLGFQLEGRLRNAARTPAGELRDTLVYADVPGGG
jgi:RimJ/RimL family protein N-acetyltransferase